MSEFVSTDDAAQVLGVSRPTIIRYIQDNRLKAAKHGKAYKIDLGDLANFGREAGLDPGFIRPLQEQFRQKRRTGRLDVQSQSQDILPLQPRLHQPLLPLAQEDDRLYYLAIRPYGGGEILVPVQQSKFVLGRHPLAHVCVQDPYISNIHATAFFEQTAVRLLDQSTNGTQLANGMLAQGESQLLGDGDQFVMGRSLLTVVSAMRVDLYLSTGLSAEAHHHKQQG